VKRLLLLLLLLAAPLQAQLAKATFAGGCFWCMEPPFEKLQGVVSVTSGYTGGQTPRPTYGAVSSGGTGHYEAVEIVYDPRSISYSKLLDVFWRNIDPTDPNGQFCDSGAQYRAAIFYRNDAERRLAEESKSGIERSKRIRVVTEVLPAGPFHRAEEYHQDYYRKNPVRYRFYRFNCGRDRRLQQIWGR
jgi:peptide-methionine (S)-S-oxide reductase